MKEEGLRAIEIVDFGSYDDDVYGTADILVFTDGKLVVPGVHYTFDGSKLEFKTKPLTDVIIYTFETKRNIVCGSFRIIHAAHTCEIPANIPIFTGKIVEKVKKAAIPTPELSEEEINDITISQIGKTTEPKEVE